MIYTGCILTPRKVVGGMRISVMSRHTLNDGKTPDSRIVSGVNYDLWLPEFGPPAKLVGDYYRRGLPWDDYEKRYVKYLNGSSEIKDKVRWLAREGLKKDVTLLCIEDVDALCHRRLLLEECIRCEPSLRQNSFR